MKQQLRPNRNITMGDRGEGSVKLSMTKKEKKEHFRNQVQVAKVRMREWSDEFVKKVYYENSTKAWHQAAKETLNERKAPRDGPIMKPQPAPKKKRRKAPKEVRQANSTNWKLDRELDNKLRNTP